MSRTHGPTGWLYRTHEDEDLHERLWGWVHGKSAWDIGANDGQSVDALVERGFTSIVALEPAIESYRILKQEWGNKSGILTFSKAAGREHGWLELSVRMTPINGGQLVSPGLPQEGWHGREMYRRRVECVTLDELQQEYGTPDFIKIDTEGFEEEILLGGPNVIAARPGFIVEYHSAALQEACLKLLDGYKISIIENASSTGNGWILAEGQRRSLEVMK